MIGWGNSFSYGTYGSPYSGYGAGIGIGSGDEQKKGALRGIPGEDTKNGTVNGMPGDDSEPKIKGKGDGPGGECETCKERKYQDGSDENVSFKSAAHIDPNSAMSAVRGHEQEHVANAYSKAAEKNGKVINASVSIQTAVCPECGRTYVAGGTTHTQIKYYNEDNPYQKDLKSADRTKYSGMNVNLGV